MTMTPREAREALGVSSASTNSEIKKRWKTLARQLHPDLGGDIKEFVKINEAYSTLCKSKKIDTITQEVENEIFDSIFEEWLEQFDPETRDRIRKQVNNG